VAISSVVCGVHASTERLLANFAFSSLSALVGRAIFLDTNSPPAAATPPKQTARASLPPSLRALKTAIVCAAAFYAFGAPMLGLIDVGGCIMFAHLKLHGGNSHAFLPTGLIQRALSSASPLDASCVLSETTRDYRVPMLIGLGTMASRLDRPRGHGVPCC
jgi:hypothetical protein